MSFSQLSTYRISFSWCVVESQNFVLVVIYKIVRWYDRRKLEGLRRRKNENYFRSKTANLAHLSVVAKHSSKMQTGCSTSKQDLKTYCYYLNIARSHCAKMKVNEKKLSKCQFHFPRLLVACPMLKK